HSPSPEDQQVKRFLCRTALPGLVLLSAAALGCTRSEPPMPPHKNAVVEVSLPVSRQVTDYEDFNGRTEAVKAVDVRARRSGYLAKAYLDKDQNLVLQPPVLKEGTEVREGQVLFEIDPRPYKAELDRAEANLVLAQAHLKRLSADLARARPLLPRKAVSQEEYDKIAGDRDEAAATVGVARAAMRTAELNLEFTRVTAPFSGRVSRRLIDPGNMVKADDTILTSIRALDPMFVYFFLDE